MNPETQCDGFSAAVPSDNGDSLVVVRARRQLRLTGRNPLRLRAIIDETAFRRRIGGPQVMRDQVEHLRQVATRPSIEIRVLPFDSGEHPGMTGPFTLLRFSEPAMDLVFVERRGGGSYLTEPAEVERHAADFEQISKMALNAQDTIEWLEKAGRELS